MYFVLLATAGNETTRHTITHGLLALLEYPDQLERAAQRPRAATRPRSEEMLRWATPVHHFRRTDDAVDTELGGRRDQGGRRRSRPGSCPGNRDESVFEDPDRFDVGRTPNKHMAFGPGGIHHCMGAHLAQMEIQIAFEELLKRVADDRARRARPSACARTSSTASSACRCG